MDVVIAQEAKESGSGHYHLLNDANTASLCGSINEESEFASSSSQVLARGSAERQGLDVCGRCSYIADERSVVSPKAND